MLFSKTFGYTVRGMLYIALMQESKRYVQAEEIASKLAVPRHFMGKILKHLVKEGMLSSTKGPSGGFTINEQTTAVPLIKLFAITEGLSTLEDCALRFNKCNALNPCPLHFQMEKIKNQLKEILAGNTIGDLLNDDKTGLIRSISAIIEMPGIEKNKSENIF